MKTKILSRLYLIAVFGSALLVSIPAEAKTSFTAPGSIVIGYDATCTGNAGAVRYNSSGPSVQWCNGTSWTTISAGSVAASGTIGATSGLTIYLTNGTVSAPSLQFYNAASTGLYYVATSTLNFTANGVQRGVFDATGNFNLATVAGRYQIAGSDILYRPVSGTDTTSIALSGAALQSQSATNSYNTGIGTWAGANVTSTHNTIIGANALQGTATITGGNNTAIGSASLNQTSGGAAGNTAVGFNAGTNVTTGTNNVLVGATAADALTTGSGHTILGIAGRVYATTFSSSTVVGYSCNAPTSGTVAAGNTCGGGGSGNNTYIGALSGYGVGSTSGGNTGLGEYTLSPGSSYTIQNNTAIGAVALQYARSTATANTAAGSTTLNGLTTGSSNTAIGSQTAYAGTAVTTGSSNTFIGAFAQTSSASVTNGMAIGYGASTTSNVIQLGNASVNVLYSYGTYSSTSDRRHKTDIRPLPEDLGGVFVNRLEPVSYRFNHGDEALRFGFIAQDLEQALPKKLQSVVERSKPNDGLALLQRDGDAKRTYRLTYSELLASVIKTIQEQQKDLQSIEKQIVTQKQNNSDLIRSLAGQAALIEFLKVRQDNQKSGLIKLMKD